MAQSGENPPEMQETACSTRDSGSISGSGRSPGEGNGKTHSSVLAWRIRCTEEPGGLQSMGLQRVRHDLETEQQLQQLVSICKPKGDSLSAFNGESRPWGA